MLQYLSLTARMNMLMHGVDYQSFSICKGDTLTNDTYGKEKMTVQVCNTHYDDPKDNTAFERRIDVMSRLMLKYGPDVLDKIEREKWEKVQEAYCEEMGNML